VKAAATVVATTIAIAFAPPAGAAPLESRASLSPATMFFGDPVTAEIEVFVDESVVDPASVRIEFATAPFRRLSSADVERSAADGVTVLRQRIRLVCAAEACLPGEEARRSAPLPVRVSARSHRGRPLALRVVWTPVQVVGRVAPEALGAEPAWQLDDTPPAPDYRASPNRLAGGLAGLAIALALVATAIVANEARRLRRRRLQARLSPLEAALAAVRAAMNQDVAERRAAVGALARALAERDGHLVRSASELAWSEQPPAPERLGSLAKEVEREVGGR
jgi:hypothetical protein